MAWILSLIGGWRAAAFLIAAVALAGYVGYQSWQLSRARADADHWRASSITASAAAHATRESFERYRADAERERAVMADLAYQVRKSAEAAASIRTEIDRAPESDDAPAAPVLDRALDRLFVNRRDGAGGGVRQPDPAAGPAVVQ